MTCNKCGSANVNIQMVSETQLKKKHHSAIYWLFIGWWLHPLLWLFLTLPMIIIRIFVPKKQKLKTTHKSMAVCQKCGYSWNA